VPFPKFYHVGKFKFSSNIHNWGWIGNLQFGEKYTTAIPKVSGLDVLDNNIFYNLYISETYIFYKL